MGQDVREHSILNNRDHCRIETVGPGNPEALERNLIPSNLVGKFCAPSVGSKQLAKPVQEHMVRSFYKARTQGVLEMH